MYIQIKGENNGQGIVVNDDTEIQKENEFAVKLIHHRYSRDPLIDIRHFQSEEIRNRFFVFVKNILLDKSNFDDKDREFWFNQNV